MHGMKRTYQQLITEYLGYFPCVVIVGARQTGKSTLISQVASNRPLFDLELRADYDQIARDPDFFLRVNDRPLAIDEDQLLPNLFPALRVAIDRDRTAYGKYLLSASSSPELLSGIPESLAGRVGIIEISPFSFAETQSANLPYLIKLFQETFLPEHILDFTTTTNGQEDLNKMAEFWFHGGYPEPWLSHSNRYRDVWREQYLKTYFERDVAKLFPHLNAVR